MSVSVMNIRIVWMGVRDLRMLMRMGVRLSPIPLEVMLMLMMLIVNMRMGVR